MISPAGCTKKGRPALLNFNALRQRNDAGWTRTSPFSPLLSCQPQPSNIFFPLVKSKFEGLRSALWQGFLTAMPRQRESAHGTSGLRGIFEFINFPFANTHTCRCKPMLRVNGTWLSKYIIIVDNEWYITQCGLSQEQKQPLQGICRVREDKLLEWKSFQLARIFNCPDNLWTNTTSKRNIAFGSFHLQTRPPSPNSIVFANFCRVIRGFYDNSNQSLSSKTFRFYRNVSTVSSNFSFSATDLFDGYPRRRFVLDSTKLSWFISAQKIFKTLLQRKIFSRFSKFIALVNTIVSSS